MHIEERIYFKEIPTPDLILNEVQKISGLEGLTLNNAKDEIIHPDFTKRGFYYLIEDNCLVLVRGWMDKWYLYDVTICALVNLGGKYDGEIPILGNKKWIEVMDQYPEVKHYWEL